MAVMQTLHTPGVYWQEVTIQPPPLLETGVPAFIGAATLRAAGLYEPVKLTAWPHFESHFIIDNNPYCYLAEAVRAFFENGGRRCYVVATEMASSTDKQLEYLDAGLQAIAPLEDMDLVCAPDVMALLLETYGTDKPRYQFDLATLRRVAKEMQRRILSHCELTGDRFALLDSYPFYRDLICTPEDALNQRSGANSADGRLDSANGALYYPWLRLASGRLVPPCGHVAGLIAQSDERNGVQKAPANQPISGVVDTACPVDDAINGELYDQQINCIRAFNGRGVRVWGARTLTAGSVWSYVSSRRLLLTVGRWIHLLLTDLVFEAQTPALWAQVERDIGAYLNTLFQTGALTGTVPEEAFYIRCNAETNSRAVQDSGQMIAEIGLALTIPNEFIQARVVVYANSAQFVLPE